MFHVDRTTGSLELLFCFSTKVLFKEQLPEWTNQFGEESGKSTTNRKMKNPPNPRMIVKIRRKISKRNSQINKTNLDS